MCRVVQRIESLAEQIYYFNVSLGEMAISCVAQTCVSWTAYTFPNSMEPQTLFAQSKLLFCTHRLEASKCCYLLLAHRFICYVHLRWEWNPFIKFFSHTTKNWQIAGGVCFQMNIDSVYKFQNNETNASETPRAFGDNRWLSRSLRCPDFTFTQWFGWQLH